MSTSTARRWFADRLTALAAFGIIATAVAMGLVYALVVVVAVLFGVVAAVWLAATVPGMDMVMTAVTVLVVGAWCWYRATTGLEAQGRYFGDWLARSRAIRDDR